MQYYQILIVILSVTSSCGLHSTVVENEIPSVISVASKRNFRTSRVLNGLDSGDWYKYFALIQLYNSSTDIYVNQCLGVILRQSWILTNAFCVFDPTTSKAYPPLDLRVVVGAKSGSDFPSTVQYFGVKTIYSSNYDHNYAQNDISILKLNGLIEYRERSALNAQHVSCEKYIPRHSKCYMIGWGQNDSNKTSSLFSRLNYAEVDLMTNEECQRLTTELNSTQRLIYDFNICAMKGGKGLFCPGDRAAALFCEKVQIEAHSFRALGFSSKQSEFSKFKDEYFIVGIASYQNDDFCPGSHPTVFTRAASYPDLFVRSGMHCNGYYIPPTSFNF